MTLQQLFNEYVQETSTPRRLGTGLHSTLSEIRLDIYGFVKYAKERGITLHDHAAYDIPIGMVGQHPKSFLELVASFPNGTIRRDGHNEFYLDPERGPHATTLVLTAGNPMPHIPLGIMDHKRSKPWQHKRKKFKPSHRRKG